MLNVKNFAAQLKKDAKELLMVRLIEGQYYISNRHYLAILPEHYVAMNPKILTTMIEIFGQDWFSDHQNVQIHHKAIGPCTVDFSKIVPRDSLMDATVTPLVWENDKRIVKSGDQLLLFNDKYIQLVDEPVTQAQSKNDILMYDNGTCKLIVLRYRTPDDVITRIKDCVLV